MGAITRTTSANIRPSRPARIKLAMLEPELLGPTSTAIRALVSNIDHGFYLHGNFSVFFAFLWANGMRTARNRSTMLVTMLLPIVAAKIMACEALVYEIKDVERSSSFAGRMGRLVHDNLTVERDGKSYQVIIQGSYHTMCVRPSDRFAVGQKVAISASPAEDGKIRVWLDNVKIVRN